jgi:hypothetical protein
MLAIENSNASLNGVQLHKVAAILSRHFNVGVLGHRVGRTAIMATYNRGVIRNIFWESLSLSEWRIDRSPRRCKSKAFEPSCPLGEAHFADKLVHIGYEL